MRLRLKLRTRLWLRWRWSRLRSWCWHLFHERRPLPALEPECEHEVVPTDNPDWGRCLRCGDSTFPMTERAAYGDFTCRTCHDTGLVPVEAGPAFADGPCPRCQGEQ